MPLKFDSNGWLIPGSDPAIDVNTQHRTGKTFDTFTKLVGGKAVGIVWHWTGGGYKTGLGPWSLSKWMTEEVVNPERKASWNFFIDKTGKLFQHASINKPTWHVGAGGRVFVPVKDDVGTMIPLPNANSALLGVEMENAGVLKSQLVNGETGWYAWPYGVGLSTCTGKSQCSEAEALKAVKEGAKFDEKYRVDSKRVVKWPNGAAYDVYTSAQIAAATALAQALKDALGWVSPKQIHYSHQQFLPGQKLDPGAPWMEGHLPQIESKVFGRRADGGVSVDATSVVLGLAALGGAYWYWQRRSRGS